MLRSAVSYACSPSLTSERECYCDSNWIYQSWSLQGRLIRTRSMKSIYNTGTCLNTYFLWIRSFFFAQIFTIIQHRQFSYWIFDEWNWIEWLKSTWVQFYWLNIHLELHQTWNDSLCLALTVSGALHRQRSLFLISPIFSAPSYHKLFLSTTVCPPETCSGVTALTLPGPECLSVFCFLFNDPALHPHWSVLMTSLWTGRRFAASSGVQPDLSRCHRHYANGTSEVAPGQNSASPAACTCYSVILFNILLEFLREFFWRILQCVIYVRCQCRKQFLPLNSKTQSEGLEERWPSYNRQKAQHLRFGFHWGVVRRWPGHAAAASGERG